MPDDESPYVEIPARALAHLYRSLHRYAREADSMYQFLQLPAVREALGTRNLTPPDLGDVDLGRHIAAHDMAVADAKLAELARLVPPGTLDEEPD